MRAMIWLLVLLAAVGDAAAGYTDYAWNESDNRSYYDCGDWSGANNSKDLSLNKYSGSGGLPAEVDFVSAKSPGDKADDIGWIFLHVQGFDKHLWHNGTIYTDDPRNINYIRGYQDTGTLSKYSWNSVLVWSEDLGIYRYGEYTKEMSIWIKYKKIVKHVSSTGHVSYSTHYTTCRDRLFETLYYVLWGTVNPVMTIGLANHSTHIVLTVPTPDNITGIKIVMTSDNTTATYEKHVACLQLNKSRDFITCDLIEYDFCNYSNIAPCGSDTYLLEYGSNYTANITLYTPFEKHYANITMIETSVVPEKLSIEMSALSKLMCSLMLLYLIYRIVGLI